MDCEADPSGPKTKRTDLTKMSIVLFLGVTVYTVSSLLTTVMILTALLNNLSSVMFVSFLEYNVEIER